MHMPRVGRILEKMSWMMECKRIKEEVKWLKALEAGIEYSRAYKEDFACLLME